MTQPDNFVSGLWSTAVRSSQKKSQSLLINELFQLLNIIDHSSLVTWTVGTGMSTVVILTVGPCGSLARLEVD